MKIVSLPETLYNQLSLDVNKRKEQLDDLGVQIYKVNLDSWKKEMEDALSSDNEEWKDEEGL